MPKKILTLLIILTTLTVAQDFTGIRIYINPGHGGHDSNDRHILATNFWESEGNLSKGLYLKEILDSLHATTKISRTQNRTQDDLGLSVISADANNFNADYFQSIHSNATGISTKRNTTLILFRGYDSSPVFPNSKIMGNFLVDEIQKAHRTLGKSVRGDWDFYSSWGKQGLGVLRGLTMPGTLSEGSFHDYIPESWRLRSEGYLKHEAWAFTKAFIKYFNLTTLPYGEIAGILRDPFDLVSYNYITSADSKVPLNFVKATLVPGNKIYNGDFFNNGFFLLDKIAPGTYDVILEAENYEKDTVTSVTVTAGKTSFADRFLIPKPDYSVPVIESFTPTKTVDVRLDSKFVFNFNVKMNKDAVQNAFTIVPSTTGSFYWELNDKKLTFTPTNFLIGGTNYQLLISTNAKSYTNVAMSESFNYSFSTRSSLKLVKSYPTDGLKNVSTTVKIKVKFDAAIDQTSLSSKVIFNNALNDSSVDLYIDEIDYANGWIIFGPKNMLKTNTNYVVKFLSGIKDVEGSNLTDDVILNFTTEHGTDISGTTVNDFEEIGTWWQPEQSGSTTGVDGNKTSFNISTKRFKSGTHSGRLNYSFSVDSNGVCRVYNQTEQSINNTGNGFGAWVFGDFSSNLLEYWFRADSVNIPIFIDTLNWTGWKFKQIDISSYNNLKFHSFVIKQNVNGERKGQVYFDAILTNVVTDISEGNNNFPTEFKLEQNYPNPFNPSTTINYTIPVVDANFAFTTNVTLKVYDILGREVATLVNENKKPGTYKIHFDASNLSSGVYYYQLKSGNFLRTKKMIILK